MNKKRPTNKHERVVREKTKREPKVNDKSRSPKRIVEISDDDEL